MPDFLFLFPSPPSQEHRSISWGVIYPVMVCITHALQLEWPDGRIGDTYYEYLEQLTVEELKEIHQWILWRLRGLSFSLSGDPHTTCEVSIQPRT